MDERKFRVLVAESSPGEIAEALRAIFPQPESKLELSVVSTIPTLLATLELHAPEAIFLELSLGGARAARRRAAGAPRCTGHSADCLRRCSR
jgi:hypothetical protein